MIKIHDWRIKYQKLTYDLHKDLIKSVYDDYWEVTKVKEEKVLNGAIFEQERIVFKYKIKEIVKKHKLISLKAVYFLLFQHEPGHTQRCKFCKEGVWINLRKSKLSSCGHVRFCLAKNCKVPLRSFCDYCDEHEHIKKEKDIEIKQTMENRKEKQNNTVYDYDIVFHWSPGRPLTVLALQDFRYESICKVPLAKIYAIESHANGGCTFISNKKHYFTWVDKEYLNKKIDECIMNEDI